MSQGIESNSTNALASPSMQEEEVRINSVSEFIEKIVQLDKEEGTEIFYRGHADRDWELLPSIFRTPSGVEKEHLLFRDMVAHEPQSFSECKSALDYLVQMQHYGLPTRLLDMTTNPLVALYFACQSVGDVNAGISAGMQIAGEHVLDIILNDPRARNFTRKEANLMIRIAYMAGALAGASSATALHAGGGALAVLLDESITDSSVLNVALFVADSSAKLGAEEGVKARAKDGVIYLFTAPENRVKHYDSDTVSVLTNLAKCKISEQCSASTPSVEDFNKQPDIARLCEQIKVEKPHFLPSIQPDTLDSLFFVKAKNGNQRITNQMGAFLVFGLGLNLRKEGDNAEGKAYLTKGVHAEIPSEWIKRKFVVPKEKKMKLLEELAHLGITESYIYPGIEQYAKELKKKYEL